MKRIFTFFCLTIILFGTGCMNKVTTYDEIDYSSYTNLIESKENFILYIGSADCSHCLNFKPTLEKIIKKYSLDVKYIDISKLTDKEYDIVKNKTKLQGTPTVVFVKDGVVQTSPKIVGAVSYSVAVEKFEESGYIK